MLCMPTKPRKMGSPYPVNEPWKDAVRELLLPRGAKTAAAKAIHTTPSAITQLLRPGSDPRAPGTSRIAKSLADYTGVPLPDTYDDDVVELAEEGRRLGRLNPTALRNVIASTRSHREAEERAAQKTEPSVNPLTDNPVRETSESHDAKKPRGR